MLGGSEGKREDRERGGFVGAVREYACIADVQIRNVVRLTKAIREETLRVVPHPQRASFMETGSRHVRLGRRSLIFRAAGSKQLLAGMFAVLPHEQGIVVPFEMQPRGGDAV